MFELDVATLARNWWMMLLRGAAAIVFGLVAIIWPGITVTVLVIFFGAYALVDGAFSIGAAIVGGETRVPRWLLVIEGLLGIGVGVVALLWPGLTAVTLLYIIAAWAIITGVVEIVEAVRLRNMIENEWFLGIAGVLSIILGIVFFTFPIEAIATVAIVAGIYAIFFGALLIVLSFRLRSLKDGLPEERRDDLTGGQTTVAP